MNGGVKVALGVVGAMFVGGVVWVAFFAPKTSGMPAQLPQTAPVPSAPVGGS